MDVLVRVAIVLAIAGTVATAHAEPDLRPWKIVPRLAERSTTAAAVALKPITLPPPRVKLASVVVDRLAKLGRHATGGKWRIAVGTTGLGLATNF